MFLEICMQIHSVVFALSRQINEQKYVKTIYLCASNTFFVTCQTQEGDSRPTPLRTPLVVTAVSFIDNLGDALRYC